MVLNVGIERIIGNNLTEEVIIIVPWEVQLT